MVLGSHNSWSSLRVRQWWLRALAWMARCQRHSVYVQYRYYGVRCFDLRVRFTDAGRLQVAHGLAVYDIDEDGLAADLDFLNEQGDVMVRVLHEVRSLSAHTPVARSRFRRWCSRAEARWPGIRWWCGRNLVDWTIDYGFGDEPSCEELYGSVCRWKWLVGWWPWLYARVMNGRNRRRGTHCEVLLIDYVDIGG